MNPGDCSASDVTVVVNMGKEFVMVDGVEGCSEVERDEDGELSGVTREKGGCLFSSRGLFQCCDVSGIQVEMA